MSHYRSDLRHTEFTLFDVLGADRRYGKAPYDDLDRATASALLHGAELFARTRLAPSFDAAEREPIRLEEGRVRLPAELRVALQDHLASDWLRLDLPADADGARIPPSLRWAATEFALGANPAVAMSTQLVPRAVALLRREGDDAQRRLAQQILDRHWTVTMVLTEPDAGSDVGAATTKAVPQQDGTWHLYGTKRFITWGEHDAAENIVHLVLARTPAGRGAGSAGLSLFVVPSHHTDPATGEPRERNGVRATKLEHKMGVVASPTCELVFGVDGVPAVGTLLGRENTGLRLMFDIITYVRMLVGLKATAALSSGYLNAAAYAATRVQGKRLDDDPPPARVPIADHPDVRRSLITQKSYAEGARALVLYTASQLDTVEAFEELGQPAGEARRRHQLLLPVVKGWCSENAWRVLGAESLQVFGGSGYLRDYPLEQYVRDTKIDTIYEGTTGIQALDLLQRRIRRDQGHALHRLLADVELTAAQLNDSRELAVEGRLLLTGVSCVAGLSKWACAADLRHAALGANRLLFALGDLVVAWLLLRAAAVALRLQRNARPADVRYLAATVATGRWFARQNLPRLSTELTAVHLLEGDDLGTAWPPA
ncbi:acyl-CoA dehydrogenase family protein [Yinghuangia sp. YIM S09857]|uniref:acyl-CoA dehydrogenase n=1 Tax=Yinghuangia sp. YIM S09857 TaxID=3436929 RepID=UPI003F5364DB